MSYMVYRMVLLQEATQRTIVDQKSSETSWSSAWHQITVNQLKLLHLYCVKWNFWIPTAHIIPKKGTTFLIGLLWFIISNLFQYFFNLLWSPFLLKIPNFCVSVCWFFWTHAYCIKRHCQPQLLSEKWSIHCSSFSAIFSPLHNSKNQ